MKDLLKIAFGLVCGLLGAGLLYLLSNPSPGEPVTLLPPASPAPITVHVTGAVTNPGVYTLPADSRVQDAIQAAGGLLPDANSGALNLAALLQDGGRVIVPTQPPPTIPSNDPASPAAPEDPTFPININTATQAELESLPEIGPVTARNIIAYREDHGPFTSIEEIMDVTGIGPRTFESIKDLITIGP